MKSILLSLLLLTGCSLFETAPASPQPELKPQIKDSNKAVINENTPRKRLMILPFLDANPAHPEELRALARRDFIAKLNRSGQLIVVDSNELHLDLSKQMKGGEYILADVGKAAGELGVAAVLEGKIMDLKVTRVADAVGVFRQVKTKFEAVIRVRIGLAKSGKEIFNTTKTVSLEEGGTRVGEGTNSEQFLLANPELMEKLVSDAFLDFEPQIYSALARLTWEGRIALINGDRIFLNVGRVSGVQVGDILRVTEEGEDVFDPQTGTFIGKSPGRLKGTLEVISFFGQDGSIAVVHSGGAFKENDRIQQY